MFDEASNDVDFEATGVLLVGPDGTDVPIRRSGQWSAIRDQGDFVLTVSSQTLTDEGEYVLSITPQDRVGNQGPTLLRKFVYDIQEPVSPHRHP